MDINQIEAMRVLVKIAEAGSFSAAAQKLRIQQSSVSRIISKLENELGVTLLTRSTRKLSLTEAGSVYLTESRRILAELENLHSTIKKTREVPNGILRISLSTAFGKWVVLPLLMSFKSKYPQVQLEIHLEDRLVDIISEAYDLVIRVGESEDSRVTSRKIAVIRRGLFVSKELIKIHGPIRKPSDLEKYPLISFDDRVEHAPSWTLLHGKIKEKVRFKSVTSVNQLDGIHLLVRDGLGIAQLPLFMGNDERIRTSLQRVLPEWNLSGDVGNTDRVYALFTGGKNMTAKVRVFLDYLVDQLSHSVLLAAS